METSIGPAFERAASVAYAGEDGLGRAIALAEAILDGRRVPDVPGRLLQPDLTSFSHGSAGLRMAVRDWSPRRRSAQTLTHMALHEIPSARVSAVCDIDKVAARTRPLEASMPEEEVLRVLATLSDRSLPTWVAGGWGIDALLGEQTRAHADLDLAYRVEDEPTLLQSLEHLGYRIVLDYRPVRIAIADDAGHEVDLHPVRFDALGVGVQTGLHDEVFHYPADAFTTGSIGRTLVACLTAEQQQRFHTGYDLRERDRADLAKLAAAFEQP